MSQVNFFDRTSTAPFVYYRSYSRFENGYRESWLDTTQRCVKGLVDLGKLTESEEKLIYSQMLRGQSMPSGRWLWVGGTEWASKPENYSGTYNCSSNVVDELKVFGYLMDLAMQGVGTGAVLETEEIAKLPPVCNRLNVRVAGEIGENYSKESPLADTKVYSRDAGRYFIVVGDSRQGWVDSYQKLIDLAFEPLVPNIVEIKVDLSFVRPAGEKLKGFGGTANPAKLADLYGKVANILNGAIGRNLNSIECSLLIDEAAVVIVAGNLRRSAGMRQFSSDDTIAADAKAGLWKQDEKGNWYMPYPERDALRMANHTRVFHRKPTLDECVDSVRKQYHSGEGAIQWAGEALVRANADLLKTAPQQLDFLAEYCVSEESARDYLEWCSGGLLPQDELNHRMSRLGLNPCLVAGTPVLTSKGHYPIEELVGKTVEIWDGDEWVEVDNFRVTGENVRVVNVTLSSGDVITATFNHDFVLTTGEKVRAIDLKKGDSLKTHSIAPKGMHVSKPMHPTYVVGVASAGKAPQVYCCTVPTTHNFALSCGVMSGNCGEILGSNFHCNLSEVHLNTLDPLNIDEQTEAFKAGAINVVALLHHEFTIERYQKSRELDPIVGVSFTGLFDFFVQLFGVEWLQWWQAGRPEGWGEVVKIDKNSRYKSLVDIDFIRVYYYSYQSDFFRALEEEYLCYWKQVVFDTVKEYCDRHNLKCPNRCTTVQPSGSKALLTGASSGWHPPKAARFIRRITFGRGEAIALAAIDLGYNVIPSQSCKDENGNLLDDPLDPRVTEWLVEIPCETSWANLEGVDAIDISQFSALAQFDFYMQVQQYYTTHNSSATIELRESEIEELGAAIYNNIQMDGGYISAALLARFDDAQTFPRLPFEPIDKETFDRLSGEVLSRRKSDSFADALVIHDRGEGAGPAPCDSDKCLIGG